MESGGGWSGDEVAALGRNWFRVSRRVLARNLLTRQLTSSLVPLHEEDLSTSTLSPFNFRIATGLQSAREAFSLVG